MPSVPVGTVKAHKAGQHEKSVPIHTIEGMLSPRISQSAFVAPSADLIGDVLLEDKVSVWFGAVLRAEKARIVVRKTSNVQDNCVVHTDNDFPVEIEECVSIGHGAIVHGAKVGRNCLIGMGAILLNGSSIGENSIVAAGSLVTQGSVHPPGSLLLGSPAKVKRELTASEIENIRTNSENYDGFRERYLKSIRAETLATREERNGN